jgi:hypothetical protein
LAKPRCYTAKSPAARLCCSRIRFLGDRKKVTFIQLSAFSFQPSARLHSAGSAPFSPHYPSSFILPSSHSFLFDTRIEYSQGTPNFFLPTLAQQLVPEGDLEETNLLPKGLRGACHLPTQFFLHGERMRSMPAGQWSLPSPNGALPFGEGSGVGLEADYSFLPSFLGNEYPLPLSLVFPLFSRLTFPDSRDINSEIKTEFCNTLIQRGGGTGPLKPRQPDESQGANSGSFIWKMRGCVLLS